MDSNTTDVQTHVWFVLIWNLDMAYMTQARERTSTMLAFGNRKTLLQRLRAQKFKLTEKWKRNAMDAISLRFYRNHNCITIRQQCQLSHCTEAAKIVER